MIIKVLMAVLHSDSTLKIQVVYQARTCNRKSDWLKNKITLINADSSTVVLPPHRLVTPDSAKMNTTWQGLVDRQRIIERFR